MSDPAAPIALTAHIVMLASISFGGFSSVLPDVRSFVVLAHGWMTDREFTNFFALAQAVPGPNMILMMSFIGWKVWGIPGAISSALATLGPPCVMYFVAHRVWNQLLASWQRAVRLRLVPVTAGLVIAGGAVMARAADVGWDAAVVTVATALLALHTRIMPTVMLVAGGVLGGCGLL